MLNILHNHNCSNANYHMLKSKIIRKSVKMQIYKTQIRPVVTYGSETWTL